MIEGGHFFASPISVPSKPEKWRNRLHNRKPKICAFRLTAHSGHRNIRRSCIPLLKTVLLVIALFLTTGCAKIADPLPPLVRIPRPAADLAAMQSAGDIALTFSRPAVNMDGSPATTLENIQVLRLEEDADSGDIDRPLPEKTFRQQAKSILAIEEADFPDYLKNGIYTVRDTLTKSGVPGFYPTALRYAVLFINDKRQAAGFSNQVRITPVSLPSHPSQFSVDATETSIHLRWEAPTENTDGTKPARIAGYNIYKASEEGAMPDTPINPEPVQGLDYEDRNFGFDRTYYYSISTVGSLKNPYAESLPSEACSVVTRDIFPPAPPDNFNAALEGSTVLLLWAPSPSNDIAGYRLFRRDKGTEIRQLLQSELLTGLSFRDEDAQSGKGYEYTIQAVDGYGNERETIRTEIELRE